MTQLVCNGVRLDLYDNTSLQYKHNNPLFAFDDLQCERTTQFKLPCTPTNDSVLSLARIPAYAGTGMRRKFAAQMTDGTVVKDGYLYVSAYDGKDYTAIFVTGDLVGLQAIQDAGSLREVLLYDNALTWGTAKDADANNINAYDVVKYQVGVGVKVNPSVSVQNLIEEALTAIGGSTINWAHATGYDKLRMFNAGKVQLSDTQIRLTNDHSTPDDMNPSTFLGITNLVTCAGWLYTFRAINDGGDIEWDYSNPISSSPSQFKQVSLPYDAILEFPRDFPDDYYLATGDLAKLDGLTSYPRIDFIDDYRFSIGGGSNGVPLAGRKVSVPANTPFVLITKAGIKWTDPVTVGQTATIGFDAALVPIYDLGVTISIDHEFVQGEATPYNAIMPDVTLVDLLKIVAAVTGTVLDYADGTISFETLDFDTMPIHDIDRLQNRGEVKRTFADYVQKNTVIFDSSDAVIPSEQLETAYYIDNDNLDAAKELQKLAASEGSIVMFSYTDADGYISYLQQVLVRPNDESDTIAVCDTRSKYMLRVSLPKNAGLQQLCTASTQYKIDCVMTLAEYNSITEKTLLLVDNTLYVWTDRSYQKNVAKFTLAKVL